MPARTPAAAVGEFIRPLQLAISCVSRAVFDAGGGYYQSDTPHVLMLARAAPITLRADPPATLDIRVNYNVAQSGDGLATWSVGTVGYIYAVGDEQGREVLAYHWHQTGRSAITTPHLHAGPAALVGHRRLSRAHLPTGLVSLAAGMRFLITDFGVHPLRVDWEQVIRETSEA